MTVMGALLGAYLSANGVWYDQTKLPSDFEGGLNLKASLTPHISLVGSGDYGFEHSYTAGAAGVRFTLSEPGEQNLSVGLGAQYNVSNKHDLRPQETSLDATVGFRPFSYEQPKVILGAQGRYGLQSHTASALIGIRYQITK